MFPTRLHLRHSLGWALLLLLLLASIAQAHGNFSPRDYPHELKGQHFTVFYALTGTNASTAEYAQQVLTLAEQAYDHLVTNGGLRPPRTLPVPIAIQADSDPGLGGAVNARDLGYDLWIQINPRMGKDFALGDVVAHEFFHVLQTSYEKGSGRPKWAIEGTAPVAVAYAYDRSSGDLDKAMLMHLSSYWYMHSSSMKDEDYMSSLFWYWLSDRYGGLTYIHRVLTWAEDVEFERAAQLAAIQGGAPADTTFDSLWREFVLAMVNGKLPEGYKAADWLHPTEVKWQGTALDVAHGERESGVAKLGYRYAYYRPLALPSYSFTLLQIEHRDSRPLNLTLHGDAGSLEAFVIRPGPAVSAVLQHKAPAPTREHPIAPPTDPATLGLRLAFDTPVRLTGQSDDRTLILVARLGNWGHGSYSLHLEPAGDVPPSDTGSPPPTWTTLDRLAQGPDSAGSPPRLTSSELAALQKGTWLSGTVPLQTETLAQGSFKRLEGSFDDPTVWDGTANHDLPIAPTRDTNGIVWYPAKPLIRLLGGTVEGNRYTLGDQWLELAPGEVEWLSSKGWHTRPDYPARIQGDEVMVTSTFFSVLNCDLRWTSHDYTIAYPSTR